jgi:iron complex outermembrane receptor protein
MNNRIFFFISVIVVLFPMGIRSNPNPGSVTLTGSVTDKSTGEPIPGAIIYIADLKTGTVTDSTGIYRLEDLPSSVVLVQVSFPSYKIISEKIDLSKITVKDFVMEESVTEINEVEVTGMSEAGEKDRTPAPVSIVTHATLLQGASVNIIDALSKQPGISQISTGPGISKPEIRGLGFNRVVIVNDGIRQEGQQWGDEHGIEIDEFSVGRVEILKGPASLSYGSDAMAGVINILSAHTLPLSAMKLNFLMNYQTNNGLISLSQNFAGNKKGFIWDLRYSEKEAHAYSNRYDGYVYNSGFKEKSFNGIIGLNKSWGYSHLHFASYNIMPGIIEGDRDSLSGKFVKKVRLTDTTEGAEVVPESELRSYEILNSVPYQDIHHFKIAWNNSFILGKASLKAIIGFQQNQRKEFSDVLSPDVYGLYLSLNTLNYDIRYELPEKKNLSILFGVNGMQQNSKNKGTEFLVPDYSLFDIGGFFIAKKSYKKLEVSGGVRYDTRHETAMALYLDSSGKVTNATAKGALQKFSNIKAAFSNVSGSLGASYHFNEKYYSKINLSRGYRAPNIAELGSNGVHEGTMRFETGNASLKPETSMQLDLAVGVHKAHISAELDLFSNHINDFIYLEKLAGSMGDSLTDGIPTYHFTSGNARLTGGEFSIDFHPHPIDWLHFENSFSWVNAVQSGVPDSMKYLPYIPAAKMINALQASAKKLNSFMLNAYAKLELENYFKQDHFYAANGTETSTPAYYLLNVGLGSDIKIQPGLVCSLYISINNITDNAYQSHLSRLKYAPENYATGRTGVYNMGRNISFKLLVPLNL